MIYSEKEARTRACIFCQNIFDTIPYKDKFICKECQKELGANFNLNLFSAMDFIWKNMREEEYRKKINEFETEITKPSADLIILALLIAKPQSTSELQWNIKRKPIYKNKDIIDFVGSCVYDKVKSLEKKEYIEEENKQIKRYKITEKGIYYFYKGLIKKINGSLGNCIIRFNSTIYLMDYIDNKEKLKYLDNIKSLILNESKRVESEAYRDGYTNRIMYNQKRCILDALLQWVTETEFDIKIEGNEI